VVVPVIDEDNGVATVVVLVVVGVVVLVPLAV
jgi:hypothetical protein